MLRQINKIKNLGTFSDYSKSDSLPNFERFNVIYGPNGSGKTTLSRLFQALNSGALSTYPELEFKVQTEEGESSHEHPHKTKIRVFNSDYVDSNIGQIDGHLNPILIIGEENRAVAQELEKEQAEFISRSSRIAQKLRDVETLEAQRGKLFSQAAKVIGASISGSIVRNYRKNNAESDYSKFTLPKKLNETELHAAQIIMRQERLDEIDKLYTTTLLSCLEHIAEVAELTNLACAKSAQAIVIARLVNNPEISTWVETGLQIHNQHEADTCEFCRQPLSAKRIKELAAHFSSSDQELKLELETLLVRADSLEQKLSAVVPVQKNGLYSELRDDLEKLSLRLEPLLSDVHSRIGLIRKALKAKLTMRSNSYAENLDSNFSKMALALNDLNLIIDKHNDKTSAFDVEVENARQNLTQHHLSDAEPEISKIDDQIRTCQNELTLLKEGAPNTETKSLETLRISIDKKRAEISNAHKAAEILTSNLHTFLGRAELKFESTDQGYLLLRNGKSADRLSEGERTAIAFMYFIVQLNDQDFSAKDGIIVIDDPISSLDSNSMYQAFAFLKNAVKGAKQIFLLTHNFDFLKLILNWLQSVHKRDKSFYMTYCSGSGEERASILLPLDNLLLRHPNEYHYLFKVLFNFKSDGKISTAYHIPNVARKLLETFFEFYAPGTESLYVKVEKAQFDEAKKTAIYKFANDLSHHTSKGFDPALVAETQKNVQYLLEMIETLAPLHYQGLVRPIESANT